MTNFFETAATILAPYIGEAPMPREATPPVRSSQSPATFEPRDRRGRIIIPGKLDR